MVETECVFIVNAMIDLDTASDSALQVLHKNNNVLYVKSLGTTPSRASQTRI
jgi:hypothetical protein